MLWAVIAGFQQVNALCMLQICDLSGGDKDGGSLPSLHEAMGS